MSDPANTLFGVETEFGCLVDDPSLGTPEDAVEIVKEVVFSDLRLGLLDLHARDDVFEPARSGGFLLNGGRLYIDAVGSHLEYATAESKSLLDLVSNDRAGHRIILRAVEQTGLAGSVGFYNNSVDHFGGHTFGCHENYLVRADEGMLQRSLGSLISFLITRIIYAGAGRVGGHRLVDDGQTPSYQEVSEHPIDYVWVSHIYGVQDDPSVAYQLSQRADHILKTVASRVRFNRAMINPKWDQYAYDGRTRLHLLFGEANQNPFAYALKVGATSLVLRLIEDGLNPVDQELRFPIPALRDISRDATLKWNVEAASGRATSAIEIQRAFLERAEEAYGGEEGDTRWTLDAWKSTLDGLQKDPLLLGDRLDWVAKRLIVDQYRTSQGLDWGDEALHSVDLEYHNIDPALSLFEAFREGRTPPWEPSETSIHSSVTAPPLDTRAKARSKLIREVLDRPKPGFYVFDWAGAALSRYGFIEMPDPLDPEPALDSA